MLRIYGIARTRAVRVLCGSPRSSASTTSTSRSRSALPARASRIISRSIRTAGCRRSTTTASCCGNRSRSRSISPRSTPPARSIRQRSKARPKPGKWSLWAVKEVDRGVNIWSLHAVRLPPEDRDPQRLAAALKVIEPPFRVLDAALARPPYLLGDDFTVADLNVAAVISRAIDMDLVRDAASRRLAQALPRAAGGARGARAQGRGGRRRAGRGDAADRPHQPAVGA